MDALRDELESYQKHLRNLLVDAVNADYDVFLSLGEGLVDVREVVDAQMAAPIEAFKRDVGATRAEIVELLNDLREKLRRRRVRGGARHAGRMLARTTSRRKSSGCWTSSTRAVTTRRIWSRASQRRTRLPGRKTRKRRGPGKAPSGKTARIAASGAKREDRKDADAGADARRRVSLAAAAAAEVNFSVAGTSVVGLDALHPGVAAAGRAPRRSRSRMSARRRPRREFAAAPRRCASGVACSSAWRAANRSRFSKPRATRRTWRFVKGFPRRVELAGGSGRTPISRRRGARRATIPSGARFIRTSRSAAPPRRSARSARRASRRWRRR